MYIIGGRGLPAILPQRGFLNGLVAGRGLLAGDGCCAHNFWSRGIIVNRDEILSKLAAGELKVEEASKLLAELDGPKRGALYCKVSEKGAVSVYGLQRMPVTLYMEQWERLFEFGDHIQQFIKDNAGSLKKKDK